MHKNYNFGAIAFAIAFLFFRGTGFSQVSIIATNTPYSQDFNTLVNTGTSAVLPSGWFLVETGTSANINTSYTAGTGSANVGDTYSFGTASTTDRALGSLRSGTLVPTIGAAFTNITGSVITTLSITYKGEQWRTGTVSRTDKLAFHYSIDSTDLLTGTWVSSTALDFTSPNLIEAVGAKDGNLAANQTLISGRITGLNIPNGATFRIRWNDNDATGADDGLAVDDFAITANPIMATTAISINDVTAFETNSGTTNFAFTVSLTSPAPVGGVTFDFATTNGTANEPLDYSALPTTSRLIAEGATSTTITVFVNGDNTTEFDETFF